MKRLLLLSAILFALSFVQQSVAATFTAVQTGNWNAGSTWGTATIPTSADDVIIPSTYTVTVNITTAVCNTLTLNNNPTLTISSGNSLTVGGATVINTPTTNTTTSSINVNSGTFSTTQLTIGGGATTRIAQLTIGSGTVTISGSVFFAADANSRLTATGTGRLNLGGNLLNSATAYPTLATINFASASIINLNGTTTQALPILASAVYGNVYFNNTSTNGATITGAITATNVLGDVRVQSGTFSTRGSTSATANVSNLNGSGFALTGNAIEIFEVLNGARANIYATFPTGFGTVTLGATSTVDYNHPTAAQTVALANYGNLTVSAGTSARTITLANSNIALGKTATASSVNQPPANAIDGDQNSRWETASSDPQWITVDLGASYSITEVRIFWEFASGKDFLIQTSPDNTTWTTVGTTTNNTTFKNDYTNLGATGRYVRMYGTARTTGYGYSIHEMEIYGSALASIGIASTFSPSATNNTYVTTSSSVIFNGTSAQVIPAIAAGYHKLTVNNTAGVSLTADVTHNAGLTFTNGIMTTGAFNLITADGASVGRTSGHINGQHRVYLPTGATVRTYYVGTASSYTPMLVTFDNVTGTGYVTGKSTAGDHPSISSSCLDATKSVNVYYTLTNNTATLTGITSIAYSYLAGNVDAAATPANFAVNRFSSSAWSSMSISGTPSSTLTTTTATGFGDYQIAQTSLVITTQPAAASICSGSNTSFTVSTTGSSFTYQWQVSTNAGSSWSNISNDGMYSNAATATLNITGGVTSMNANQYRVSVNGCSNTITSNAATLTITTIPISQVSTTGLTTRFDFTGNANDLSGNATPNTGIPQNAPTLTIDRFNNANRAYTFNGTNQSVRTTNSYAPANDFSLSIWFNTTSSVGGKLIGLSGDQNGGGITYDRHVYMTTTGHIIFGVYPNTVKTIMTPDAYNDGVWHNVTATLSSTGGMSLYIDGVLKASDATVLSAQGSTGYWTVGYGQLAGWTNDPSNNYFNGKLDDVLIYSRAITAAEVTATAIRPAGAGHNAPICGTGGTLSLDATTVGGATYSWTGPNSFTSSLQNPTISNITAANAGVYTMTITSGACSAPAYVNVIINALPAAPTAIADAAVCGSGTIQLTGSGATYYKWYNALTNGTLLSSASTYTTPTITSSTTYYLSSLSVAGCESSPRTSIVATVNPIPATPTITGTNTYCVGNAFSLTASSATSSVTYAWTAPGTATGLSGAATANITKASIATTEAGNYSVIASLNGCSSAVSSATAVTVNIIPATPTITGTNTYCVGNAFSLTASSATSSVTYAWTAPGTATGLSGAATANLGKASIATTEAGNYTVVASLNGCSSAASSATTVTVNTTPATPTITGTTTYCVGNAFGLAASSATPSVTYAWTTPGTATGLSGTATANITKASIATTEAGNYSVVATLGSCPSAASSITTVMVNTLPSAPSTTGGTRCGTGTVNLSASGSTGTYGWYAASSGGSSLSASASYTTPSISVTTTYYVSALSLAGCESSSRTSVIATINTCVATWTGASSTAWGLASNWSPAVLPTAVDTVVITSSAVRMPTVSTTVNAAGVKVNNGATLTLASNGTLNAYGDVVNSGTVTPLAASTLGFKGTSAQTLSGIPVLYNVSINNAAGVTVGSTLLIKGSISLISGTLASGNFISLDVDNGGNIGYNGSDAGSISGNVSMFRTQVIAETHYISCPLNGVTVNDLADDAEVINPTNGNSRLFVSNFASQKWSPITNLNQVFVPGNAYSMYFPIATALDFTGTYTHGISNTYNTGDYANTTVKYVMVGNPYPSTLDWDAASGWTKSNVKNAIYFWDDANNRYASYVNGVGVNNGTKYIPIMNSFFVATDGLSSPASVLINNNARTTTTASFWRTGADETVRLVLKGSAYQDEAVIRYNQDASPGFDNNLDAYKIMNSGTTPSVFTKTGGSSYSINSLADAYSIDSIPVGAKIPADGMYTLSIANSDPSIGYILRDKKLNIEQKLGSGSYSFAGLKTDNPDRFVLMRVALTTNIAHGNDAAGLQVYSAANGFMIRTDAYAGKESTIEVLDLAGKRLQTLEHVLLESGNTFVTLQNVASGAYLIRVNTGDAVFADHITLIK